jgi:hypothetical protein
LIRLSSSPITDFHIIDRYLFSFAITLTRSADATLIDYADAAISLLIFAADADYAFDHITDYFLSATPFSPLLLLSFHFRCHSPLYYYFITPHFIFADIDVCHAASAIFAIFFAIDAD